MAVKVNWLTKRRDLWIAALLFLIVFALYLRTLAPSVAFLFDDTLEFQYIVPRLGIIHPTGYPLYALLGKFFTLIVPLNDPAFRLNLLSALNGALAVAMIYIVARKITKYQLPAILSALTFSVGQTFWSQAVIAETYTTQMLFVALLLYLALTWREEIEQGDAARARRWFYALAFVMGAGLTHHRLLLLLYPATASYVLLTHYALRNTLSFLRDWKFLTRSAVLFLISLSLYVYLPLRGAVGSADGKYENTLNGFIVWVTAQEYTVFLSQNPLNVQRDLTFYISLFMQQFTVLGLFLAAIGILWLLRRPREWLLLILALALQLLFVFNYRVANVYVHFQTTFLLLALFLGAGADALIKAISNFKFQISNFLSRAPVYLFTCLLVYLIPLQLLITNYPVNDLSNKWDIHDYGLDILAQPLEDDSTIVGILGEMTLLRYFQDTRGVRLDVQTVAADKEDARLAAIEHALQQNRAVYLTRSLKDAAEKYALSSFGPLIRVRREPTSNAPKFAQEVNEDFGNATLLGYDLDATRLEEIPGRWHADNGRVIRVTLHWAVNDKFANDAMLSLKLLGKDKRIAGQIDRRPVRDAYPTNIWRAGEVITDTYDVPIFLGAPPGEYTLGVTMYDADSGKRIGQRDLTKVTLAPDLNAPRRDVWNIAAAPFADFGALALAGYTLDADAPARPGEALPLTLLWRAHATKIADSLKLRVWLEDNRGNSVASRETALSAGFPVAQWQANQFVRESPAIRIPANVSDGKYAVKLAVVRRDELLRSNWVPFGSTIVTLGQAEIKNRTRVKTPPAFIARVSEATFDKKIKLLGYDLKMDSQRNVRLTLYWRALGLMDTSYTVFVHLLDDSGGVRASGDSVPGSGEFSTTGWIEDEYINDLHNFSIPPDMAPGDYQIEIGWYDAASGARLKTADGQDRVILAPINIPQ